MTETEQSVKTTKSIKMGSTVKETQYGFEGIVDGLYLDFWKAYSGTGVEARAWLGLQLKSFTEQQINKERWFRIAVHNGGGTFMSCESRLIHLTSPTLAPDPTKAPLEPWTIWARIVAMESETGSRCLYLDDRVSSWRGELPLLFLDSVTFTPTIGDLIEGDAKQVIIHHRRKVYEFIRKNDSLTQVIKKK